MKKFLHLAAACTLAFSASAAGIDANTVYSLQIPSTEECSNLTVQIGPYSGLGFIALNAEGDIAINRKATTPVQLYFDGSLLASIDPANDNADLPMIEVISAGAMDEDDPAPASATLYLLFDPSYVSSPSPKFQKTGIYTLVIPAGVVTSGGVAIEDYQVSYHYDADAVAGDVAYEITPAPDTNVENLSNITIKFPEASYLSYAGIASGIKLTLPDGTVVKRKASPNLTSNSASFSFVVADWAPGTYTLNIPKGLFCINNPYWEEEDGTGNVQAITASWTIGNTPSGVEVNGADATITVFSIDGVKLLENAPAEELDNLPAGLYIVNGKKVIRK